MKAGVVFPQIEIGSDPGAIREYVQTAEGLGYSHMLVYDQVLGADTDHYPNWQGGYSSKDMFHEPFVLFGYLAGITTSIQMVAAVVILGQRQTALVAKQAAEVDVLTGGRLRLGVGRNYVQYEALGENFHDRGRRSSEQIELLRALWTQEVVDFHGRYHQVTHAGINPLPVQRPIPIWMGAGGDSSPVPTDPVLKRIVRLADGWFPQISPEKDGPATIAKLAEFAREAGRDPSTIGMEASINASDGGPDFWQQQAEAWQRLGSTHVSINTMRAGYRTLEDHINAIQRFKEVVPA